MRISPSPLLKAVGDNDNLFKAYSVAVGQNIGDARDRAAPIVMKAGNPQGQLQVAGLKGKFWGQRPLPDGGNTTMMFYMPTDENNNPIAPGAEDIQPGDPVLVQPNSDTQPLTWRYNMKAGKQYSGWDVETSPCSNPNGSVCWGSQYPCPGFPKTTYSPSNSPFHLVNTTGGNTGHQTAPLRSANPPVQPADGYMWQSDTSNVTYRWDANAIKWFVQSGKTSGTFVVRQCAVSINKGQVVAESGSDGVTLADNTTLSQFGKVVGIATENGLTGEFIVIQESGDFSYTHFFTNNAILYLNTTGGLTTTPPVLNGSGSQLIFQQIAIAKQGYLTIAPGIPILTLASSTANPVIIPNGSGTGLAVGVPPGGGYAANFGDGTNTVYTINHALGTRDVTIQVYRNGSPYDDIGFYAERTDANNVTLTVTPIPSTNQFRVVVKP